MTTILYITLVVVAMTYLIYKATRKPKPKPQRDEVTLHVVLGADERERNNDNQ